MIYINRKHMNVLNTDNNKVFFSQLEFLINYPTNEIYIEKDGEYYGNITHEEIKNSFFQKKDYVEVKNKTFELNEQNYYKALNKFKEHPEIKSIPIVVNKKIIGEYKRSDDIFLLETQNNFINNKFIKLEGKIALVKPSDETLITGFNKLINNFNKVNYIVDIISKKELYQVEKEYNYIFFISEEELNSTLTYYLYVLGKQISNVYKFLTIKTMNYIIQKEMQQSVINYIKSKGINIFNMCFYSNGSDYFYNMEKELIEKYTKRNSQKRTFLYPEDRKEFFGKLYNEEYANNLCHLDVSEKIIDGITYLKDQKTKYLNIKNGERVTFYQPKTAIQHIYFFGPCISMGNFCEDKHTIESFLQKEINNVAQSIQVVNKSSFSDVNSMINKILSTPLQKNDIIFIYAYNNVFDNITNINLYEILEKNNVKSTYLVDSPVHCNYLVNEIYAKEFFKLTKKFLTLNNASSNININLDKNYLINLYISRYFYNLDLFKYNKVGSIVMNCNPFTLGHRHLIEEALKVVDFLVIFVVEEDKSVFSFDFRYSCVKKNVEDLKNVFVAPSGDFIISKTTFPEYFIKVADEDIKVNIEKDLVIFSQIIAPKLNIKYRFVGEENNDDVTNKYNIAMKNILPKNGIELIEVPRKKFNGIEISASIVRKKLENNELDNIDKFLTNTTKKMLNI